MLPTIDAAGDPTPQSLSLAATQLYCGQGAFGRFLAKYRPRICPFHLVIPQVPAGASALDIGCGNGLMLALLADSGKLGRGVGFDSSGVAIDAAHQMLAELKKQRPEADLTFVRLDVGQPWPDGQFDVVMLVDVLHHIPPAAQGEVFRSAARKLRPGGRLIYKDMARRPHWRAAMNRLHDLLMARQWIHYVPIESVEQWAGGEKLNLAASADVNMLWYRHHLRVFDAPS
jgi:SAM-dependent methyltransferase